jgi:hypothetical protein
MQASKLADAAGRTGHPYSPIRLRGAPGPDGTVLAILHGDDDSAGPNKRRGD